MQDSIANMSSHVHVGGWRNLDASVLKESAQRLPHQAPLTYCQLLVQGQHACLHNINCVLDLGLCQELLDGVQMQQCHLQLRKARYYKWCTHVFVWPSHLQPRCLLYEPHACSSVTCDRALTLNECVSCSTGTWKVWQDGMKRGMLYKIIC